MPLVNVVKKYPEKGLSRIKVRVCVVCEKLIALLFHSLFSVYPPFGSLTLFPFSFFI